MDVRGRSPDLTTLLKSINGSDTAAWVAVPVEGWASESLQITRSKSVGSCVSVGSTCAHEQGCATYSQAEEPKAVSVPHMRRFVLGREGSTSGGAQRSIRKMRLHPAARRFGVDFAV